MFTDAPFLHVEGGCVIMNRIWDADQISELPVGQLPTLEADFVQDERFTLPPGFHSNHVCREEWLATGEPYPNDLPPTEYDDYQIPVCCGFVTDSPRGGVAVGGSAGDTYRPSDSTVGGLVIGGSAGDGYRPPDSLVGGLYVGGAVGDSYRPPDSAVGGVVIGGAAGDSHRPPDSTAGGVEIGGSAGDIFIVVCEEEECCPLMGARCDGTTDSCLECYCEFFNATEFSIWRRYPTTNGNNYNFTIVHHPGSGGSAWTLWGGDTCDDLTAIAFGTEHPNFQTFDFAAIGDYVWLEVTSPMTTTVIGWSKLSAL